VSRGLPDHHAPDRPPAPPSGWLPPASALTADGEEIDLIGPARASSDAFIAAHPEYLERYGAAGRKWCVHDHQHVLNWAITRSAQQFAHELDWLAGVLDARGFPLPWLAEGTERLADALAAQRPEQTTVVAILRRGAQRVRDREDPPAG
jgi:hypothetical protein